MPTTHDALDAALKEVIAARTRVRKIADRRVRGVDDIASLKATAQTWFYTHRRIVAADAPNLELANIDDHYTRVLEATVRQTARQVYLDLLSATTAALVDARTAALRMPPASDVGPTTAADDLAPDFSPLAGNQAMRDILTRRWHECARCVRADAHLAAIVMMGGFLEALFVARANGMPDKSPLVAARDAPKDRSTGKVVNFQEWMLDSYIKVACELGWITESARAVADTLKEYRNFVHPAKELRYGVTLGLNDSTMFWQVTKALARQLLLSA